MSFYALNGLLGSRICRHTILWAAMRRRVLLRPIAVVLRDSHSSLYQMVKKRTLEARTKLQANRFPNNEACAQVDGPPGVIQKTQSITAKSNSKAVIFSKTLTTPINTIKPDYPTHPELVSTTRKKNVKKTAPPKQIEVEKPTKDCRNTEVLRALDVDANSGSDRSQKTVFPNGLSRSFAGRPSTVADNKKVSGEPYFMSSKNDAGAKGSTSNVCEKPAQNDASSAGENDECSDDGNDGKGKSNSKLLYAVLAAMGAGGFLWWFLGRKKVKEPVAVVDDCVRIKTIPESSANLPKHVPYLLIGGGTAAFSAFRAIKSNDPVAKVLMITDEMRNPYMRPPLSKELWYSASQGEGMQKDLRFKQWTGAERSLYFEPEEFFVDPTALLSKPNGGIAVAQGFKVTKVNPEKRIVTLEDGCEIAYDECLIATGCSPKNLSVFDDAPISVRDKVMVYRTPDDFETLKKYADENKTIAIIGNGFTGSELACSLANYTKNTKACIYQIFPEVGNMSRVLPQYLSKWTTKKVESTGVSIINRASVKEATRVDSKLKLVLSNGKTLIVDCAVVCAGCDPNTALAGPSGLEVSKRLGGFVVNSELEARRNLYVAGDASCFYDPLLGRRRVEHHDHSVVSGRLAGENMAGKNNSYTHQSMFWSDLGPEIGYEGIGLVDASLPTVGIFALPSLSDSRTDNLTEERKTDPGNTKNSNDLPEVTCDIDADEDNYGRGVIFYIKENKIVGILLWNLFNRIGLARTIITQNKKYDDLNEVAKLFEIHS